MKTCHKSFSPRMFQPVMSLMKTLPGRPQSLIFNQSAGVILRDSISEKNEGDENTKRLRKRSKVTD